MGWLVPLCILKSELWGYYVTVLCLLVASGTGKPLLPYIKADPVICRNHAEPQVINRALRSTSEWAFSLNYLYCESHV